MVHGKESLLHLRNRGDGREEGAHLPNALAGPLAILNDTMTLTSVMAELLVFGEVSDV